MKNISTSKKLKEFHRNKIKFPEVNKAVFDESSFMPQNYDRFAEPVYEEVEIECPDCESFILFIF